jgi:hypothetical protein
MMREYHVRFRERFGVKLPLPTRLGATSHEEKLRHYLDYYLISTYLCDIIRT